MMTKKESAAQPEPSQIKPEAPKSIEEIILDYQKDKYMAVPLASFWATVLQRREENRHRTFTEVSEMALRDVLTGVVDWDTVKKAVTSSAEAPAASAAAEKAPKG